MPQFNPYRKWLGIPESNRSPNFYDLLGLPLFENDPEVIHNAADAKMAYVRTFATGPHGAWSQRILNELSQARITLCDLKKKTAYDAALQRHYASMPKARLVNESPPSSTKTPTSADGSVSIVVEPESRRPKRRLSPVLWLLSIVLTAVVAVVILQTVSRPDEPEPNPPPQVSTETTAATDPAPRDLQHDKPVVVDENRLPNQAENRRSTVEPDVASANIAIPLDKAGEDAGRDEAPKLSDLVTKPEIKEEDPQAQPVKSEKMVLDFTADKMQSPRLTNEKEKVAVSILGLQSNRQSYLEPAQATVGKDRPVNIRFRDYEDVRLHCVLEANSLVVMPQVNPMGEWLPLTRKWGQESRRELDAERVQLMNDIRRLSNQRVPTAEAYNRVLALKEQLRERLYQIPRDLDGVAHVEQLARQLDGRSHILYQVIPNPTPAPEKMK